MHYQLSEIKVLRKKFGLTQAQLAKASGVSQSMIAKVEASLLDPSFSIATRLFSVLDQMSEHSEKKASDLMHRKILFASPETAIKDVVELMRKHGISQLPVMKNHAVIGMISEGAILDALLAKKAKKIGEIMQDAPPIINAGTPAPVVHQLLRHAPVLIVQESGKFVGVITKADVISKM